MNIDLETLWNRAYRVVKTPQHREKTDCEYYLCSVFPFDLAMLVFTDGSESIVVDFRQQHLLAFNRTSATSSFRVSCFEIGPWVLLFYVGLKISVWRQKYRGTL